MDLYITAIIQGVAFASMALGIFLTLRIFNIPDITTDGSFTLGGSVTAVMLVNGYTVPVTLAVALLSGALAGMCTGLIHTRFRINALLAGILVMTALYSVNLSIMGRPNIPLIGVNTIYDSILADNKLVITAIVISVVTLAMIWLLKTDFGIAMRATGNSEKMIRAVGVNPEFMKITGIAIANALTALSGFLMVQYQGFSDINMGIGIVISGLAAVILGESLLRPFKGSSLTATILVVVAGSIVFRVVLAMALSFGLDPNMLKLTTAVIVLVIIAISRTNLQRTNS